MEFQNQSLDWQAKTCRTIDLIKTSNFASMMILKLLSLDVTQISHYTYKDVLPIYYFSSFKQLKIYFDSVVKSFDKKEYLDLIKNNNDYKTYYFIIKNPNVVITKIYKGVKLENIIKEKK